MSSARDFVHSIDEGEIQIPRGSATRRVHGGDPPALGFGRLWLYRNCYLENRAAARSIVEV